MNVDNISKLKANGCEKNCYIRCKCASRDGIGDELFQQPPRPFQGVKINLDQCRIEGVSQRGLAHRFKVFLFARKK